MTKAEAALGLTYGRNRNWHTMLGLNTIDESSAFMNSSAGNTNQRRTAFVSALLFVGIVVA
jgi:hypothetical protein